MWTLKLCLAACLLTLVTSQSIYFESRNLYPASIEWDQPNQRFLLGSFSRSSLTAVYMNGTIIAPASEIRFSGPATTTFALGVRSYPALQQVLVSMSAVTTTSSYMVPFNSATLQAPSGIIWTGFQSMAGIARQATNPSIIYAADFLSNQILIFNETSGIRKLFNSPVFSASPEKSKDAGGVYGLDAWKSYFVISGTSRGELYKYSPEGNGTVTIVTLVNATLNLPRLLRFNSYGQLAIVTHDTLYILESSNEWASAYTKKSYSLDSSSYASDVTWVGNDTYVVYSYVTDFYNLQNRTTFLIQKVPSFAVGIIPLSYLGMTLIFFLFALL